MPFIVLISAIAVAGIDQLLKFLVAEYLKPVSSVDVIPGLFSLTYVENKGAAFGIMSNMRWVFIVFTLIIVAVLIYIVIKNEIKSKLFIVSAILLIGGGIGNLIDRIFNGYVIDYLSLSFFPPVCNFADYCITFGSVILVIYLIFFSNFFKDNKKVKADE